MRIVDHLKEPVTVGETYLVPCVKRVLINEVDEQELWMDLMPATRLTRIEYIPIINLLHNDIENGQAEQHYHVDTRFPKPVGVSASARFVAGETIHYVPMQAVSSRFTGATPVSLIKGSRLKHRCIKNGKCPHRGYDLSQVNAVDGEIVCPLHGLRFDSITKKLK